LIAKGCPRQYAYSLTQRISLQAWNTEKGFKQLLSGDPDIQKYLDNKEIGKIFSVNYHLKHVEEIFARVFQ
jgi:adenylosuccinate lyase